MPSPWKVSPSPRRSDSISLVNCRSTNPREQLVPPGRVLDHFRAIEGRAEHRRVGVLAAQPATDAAVDYRGHRVAAQRIGVVFDGERRAPRQADAGVVSGAGVFVDAVFHAHMPFPLCEPLRHLGFELSLALELALAFGDDD